MFVCFSNEYKSREKLQWPKNHSSRKKRGKGTGAEMRRAITSGIVLGDALVSYWPIFFLSLVTILEVFAKVNSAQFPFRFESSEFL